MALAEYLAAAWRHGKAAASACAGHQHGLRDQRGDVDNSKRVRSSGGMGSIKDIKTNQQ